MSVKDITKISMLAALIFTIYLSGSMIMYVELFNFTVLLYGVTLPKKTAYLSLIVFCSLLILVYGLQVWTLMYLVVFPQYILIYHLVGSKVKSEYVLASVGFILAFACGTLIDLPFIIMSGLTSKALILRLLLGFQVSFGNGLCTFIATLYLLNPMRRVMMKLKS
ncbi:MAG TPA: hypothetical protein DCY20_02420 [Firmicutes bacterium]|nr:hypothetical protein [Bacillota bacterium]